MSSDMKDTDLERRIENMLDFFTQPGEKYLKDLQNDLLDLIKRETDKAYKQGWEAAMNQQNVSKRVDNPNEQHSKGGK